MFFDKNIVEAKANNIANGAYHFFSTESPGIAQAANYLSVTSPYNISLPPVLDFEAAPPMKTEDVTDVLKEVRTFLSEVEESAGIRPIIYTTYESYGAYLSNGFNGYSFWFRDFLKYPSVNENLSFWQYCNRGRLFGIDESQKYVDLNVFIGSEQEFNYLFGVNDKTD